MKGEIKISEVISASKGRLLKGGKELSVRGVSIDTRTIKEGDLFVAIKGDRFNGHDFIGQALANGASGIVINDSFSDKVDRGIIDGSNVLIAVEDTLISLQEIATFHRQKYTIPVVAVTGTNGKTTTKEMIAKILGKRLSVVKNEGNLNNHIGVPLTLLRLNKSHQAAVIEMGMSALGEIARLCEIAAPNIGVITNIGMAHLDGLGRLENIIKAKGELIDALSESDTAVINADDPNSADFIWKIKGKIVTFGIDKDADVSALDIRFEEAGLTAFTLRKGSEKTDIRISMPGRHNIYNALAAAAVACSFNFDLEDIKEGLDGFEGFKMRSEVKILDSGLKIINDSYNANPASMEAAIKLLSGFKKSGKTFAVLGDMLELGEHAVNAHVKVGRIVADAGIDYLIVMGEFSQFIVAGASERGMKQDNIFVCIDHKEVQEALDRLASSSDTILIKGSRKMSMEKIADGLIKGDYSI